MNDKAAVYHGLTPAPLANAVAPERNAASIMEAQRNELNNQIETINIRSTKRADQIEHLQSLQRADNEAYDLLVKARNCVDAFFAKEAAPSMPTSMSDRYLK